eukprot:TRINITY_DN7100_c0_g1_i1.p1 TRINITY_DN7100_c0_g1~~TRINITY_DN7100_c0_g1_i1.p1  ORF type:complete len:515 (-),score=152.29 TRINITY_DN7100_c0_g1_i1:133-1578(-)
MAAALQHSSSAPSLKGRRLGRDQIPLLASRTEATPSLSRSQSSTWAQATRLPASSASVPAPPDLEFESWKDWRGRQVANFLDAFCGLPQYRTTAERNLTGKNLVEMTHYGIMNKGLARAGIVDFDHLRRIASDVLILNESTLEELQDELYLRQQQRDKDLRVGRLAEQHLWARHSKFKTPANNLCKETFHIDRTEEVAIHWWRHRRTHAEMQKSASSGSLTDSYVSSKRMTQALCERPAMSQHLASTKKFFETGYVMAEKEAQTARIQAAEAALKQAAERVAREDAARRESATRQAREDAARQEAEEAAAEEARRLEEEKIRKKEEAAKKKEEEEAARRLEEELRAAEEAERKKAEEEQLLKDAQAKAKKAAVAAAKKNDPEAITKILTEMFTLNDIDGKGHVTIEESLNMNKKMSEGLGIPFDEEAARATFASTDTDGDGFVSLEEFIDFSKKGFEGIPMEDALLILYQILEVLKVFAKK